jgi:ribA/ribD-fused uncharacterized protein
MTSISEFAKPREDPGFREYRRAECVVFCKTREAFGGLSNMASGYPLRVGGIYVPTSEALYQACRFPHLPNVQDIIIRQKSPMTAKMKSKKHRPQSREDWDSIRVAVMKWCLKIKLAQHWRRFGELLLETSDKPIVEQSRKDRFWGAILEPDGESLSGYNVLGRLLMDIRMRLRKDPSEFGTIRPISIPDFLLLGQPIKPVQREAPSHYMFDDETNEAEAHRQQVSVSQG